MNWHKPAIPARSDTLPASAPPPPTPLLPPHSFHPTPPAGVFGGSNALWKTDDLKAYQFRSDVQTEDIELSTRAMLGGKVKISFCPECRSGELPPATLLALYRQRLRWALGWDQVTLQHARHIHSANLKCGEKLGLYYILPLRWGLLFSATLNALVAPVVSQSYLQAYPGSELGGPIETCVVSACASAAQTLGDGSWDAHALRSTPGKWTLDARGGCASVEAVPRAHVPAHCCLHAQTPPPPALTPHPLL